ncbi:hypothetical protein EMCRGX_G031892 [Ephydatia muelleri]
MDGYHGQFNALCHSPQKNNKNLSSWILHLASAAGSSILQVWGPGAKDKMAVSLDTSLGVSCPVCYTDYSDEVAELVPRILSCGHTYCTQCLEKLLNSEDEQQEVVFSIRQRQSSRVQVLKVPRPSYFYTELKCPICNTSSSLPKGSVASLTKNYAVLNCKQKADNSSASVGKSKSHYCSEHDHEQRVFCKDCKSVICVYCQLYGNHKGHECALAADLVKPAIETMESAVVSLNDHLHDITGAESAVKEAMDRLRSSQQECLGGVQFYFQSVAELLVKEKEKRIAEINSWVEDQWDVLQAQLQCLNDTHKECESTLEECQALIRGDSLDILSQHEDKLQDIGSVCKKIQGLSFDPLITPIIKCNCKSTKKMVLTVSNGCKIILECLQEEQKQHQGSGEEATEGAGVETFYQDKAKYTTSSPLNNSTSFPRLEPLDIKFHDWPKLEPQQLNLKEPSRFETISIEQLDITADSADSCSSAQKSVGGSTAARSNSVAHKSASPEKLWFDNLDDSSSISIPSCALVTLDSVNSYVHDHRTETDGDLSMSLHTPEHVRHTPDHVREEHSIEADEEDEGEGGE